MSEKKLYLIDAYALIFRGYYALIKNPRINSKGIDTSAILGFVNSLLEILKKEQPDFMAVAFDKGGSTDRLDIFPEYKANRSETPEAISIAVPIIQNILRAMNITILELKGYEADDIIGTVAKRVERENFKVIMVTSDKDFAQLVSPNIYLYKPSRMGNSVEIWGDKEVKEKFEVENPLQVIDLLAMMGDSVDNIPGLPGVGEKTAKKFIKEYGSIENLLDNTENIKGKLKEKLDNSKDLGLLSKKLATIMLNVPIEVKSENFKLSKPDMDKLQPILEELEFIRITETIKKMYGENISRHKKITTPQQLDIFDSITPDLSIEKTNFGSHFYQIADTEVFRRELIKILKRQNQVAVAVVTQTHDEKDRNLCGISFSWSPGKAYYLPITKGDEKSIIGLIKPFLEDEEIEKIGYDVKRIIQVISNYGVDINSKWFDVMIAHYLINPDIRHRLDILSENYLNHSMISFNENDEHNTSEIALERADIIMQLKPILENQLSERKVSGLFYDLEMPLSNTLACMETEGININVNYLKSLDIIFEKEIEVIEKSIYKQSGETFNISSPKQLGVVLFEKLKIVKKIKKTKTGQYSTSEEVLSSLSKENTIVCDILEYRKLKKLQNTYVKSLPNDVDKKTNRVHTIYNQAVAATGRLSSNKPNLQNIPIRSERGRMIRKAFVARDEKYELLSADYSQIELRIIASISEEKNMIEDFMSDRDIHAATASKVFGVPIENVSREQRSQAKTVNFGIIYGVSAFGLSNQSSLSRSESKEMIDNYYKTYPGLKNYIDRTIAFAREKGYVETVLGRRRYLRDINSNNHIVRSSSERNAINAPIQGSAADIIKLAMVKINNKIHNRYRSKMLLQVHDELVFDVYKSEKEEVSDIIRYEMENAFKFKVPLKVDMGWGNNWFEAH